MLTTWFLFSVVLSRLGPGVIISPGSWDTIYDLDCDCDVDLKDVQLYMLDYECLRPEEDCIRDTCYDRCQD